MTALATLFYTNGNIHTLITMYSINVFLTFALSNLGMSRRWIQGRKKDVGWQKKLAVHLLEAAAALPHPRGGDRAGHDHALEDGLEHHVDLHLADLHDGFHRHGLRAARLHGR